MNGEESPSNYCIQNIAWSEATPQQTEYQKNFSPNSMDVAIELDNMVLDTEIGDI